jgi:type 1 fimbria pilin
LTYYVVPERTRAALAPGAFRASVDFRLNYD